MEEKNGKIEGKYKPPQTIYDFPSLWEITQTIVISIVLIVGAGVILGWF